MTAERNEPFVETTYPGQQKRTSVAPRHVVEHYGTKSWDLPFVQPVGKFKQAVDGVKTAQRKHQEMLDRDGQEKPGYVG